MIMSRKLASSTAGSPSYATGDEAEPLLATIRETCILLRCGKSKVFELCKDNTLERRKIGRSTRVTMASIRKIVGAA